MTTQNTTDFVQDDTVSEILDRLFYERRHAMQSSPPIQTQTKNEQVFQRLRDDILTGQLVPGEVYSAASLAERLGVSRTPVNTAIKLLSHQGLIELRPNVGFEVKPLEWAHIEERMEIKCQLEMLVLRRMVQHATAEDLDALLACSGQVRRAIRAGDGETYFQRAQELHFGFSEAGKAYLCLDYFRQSWDYEGWYAVEMDQNRAALEDLCNDHDAMLHAVMDKDTEEALRLAGLHHSKCMALLKKNLKM